MFSQVKNKKMEQNKSQKKCDRLLSENNKNRIAENKHKNELIIPRKYNKIQYKKRKSNKISLPGVSIITCTMRPHYIDNVFNNYDKQDYKNKELIVILNNNSMDIDRWKAKSKKYKNVKVFQLDEEISLGECLNFGVKQSSLDFIAKFDDDDYYGPKYLINSMEAFSHTDAGLVGKATSFVYFEDSKILATKFPIMENRYVNRVDGSTMIIKREVLDKVKFANMPKGIDAQFSKDCIQKGIKVFSTNRFHYVYIRHSNPDEHTWTISNNKLMNWCINFKRDITDYTKYVDR